MGAEQQWGRSGTTIRTLAFSQKKRIVVQAGDECRHDPVAAMVRAEGSGSQIDFVNLEVAAFAERLDVGEGECQVRHGAQAPGRPGAQSTVRSLEPAAGDHASWEGVGGCIGPQWAVSGWPRQSDTFLGEPLPWVLVWGPAGLPSPGLHGAGASWV